MTVGPTSRSDVSHPSRVFQEYAQRDEWILAHLGQFAGYLFAFAGLMVLTQLLMGERTRGAIAAYLGLPPAGHAAERLDGRAGHLDVAALNLPFRAR